MCFGVHIEWEEEGIKSETLCSFVASSLNVELVYIILKGIKRFSNVKDDEKSNSTTRVSYINNCKDSQDEQCQEVL